MTGRRSRTSPPVVPRATPRVGLALGCDYPTAHMMISESIASRDRGKLVLGAFAFQAVGALIGLAREPDLMARLGLDRTSRVLLIGTEGATDPAIYREIVGRRPEEIAAS